VNHIRFPKEEHLPDCARRDNKVTKGDCVEPLFNLLTPNINYNGRTAPLISEVAFYIFIQQI